jgi:hypothetical protein
MLNSKEAGSNATSCKGVASDCTGNCSGFLMDDEVEEYVTVAVQETEKKKGNQKKELIYEKCKIK